MSNCSFILTKNGYLLLNKQGMSGDKNEPKEASQDSEGNNTSAVSLEKTEKAKVPNLNDTDNHWSDDEWYPDSMI
jgi:hypothetical protein